MCFGKEGRTSSGKPYADDLVAISGALNRKDLEHKSKIILELITNWCLENKMTISTYKTKIIIFGTELKRDPIIKQGNRTIKFEIIFLTTHKGDYSESNKRNATSTYVGQKKRVQNTPVKIFNVS